MKIVRLLFVLVLGLTLSVSAQDNSKVKEPVKAKVKKEVVSSKKVKKAHVCTEECKKNGCTAAEKKECKAGDKKECKKECSKECKEKCKKECKAGDKKECKKECKVGDKKECKKECKAGDKKECKAADKKHCDEKSDKDAKPEAK